MEKYKNIAAYPDTPFPRANWSPDDIPYGMIEPSRVADDLYLFYMVAAASLVEINSDLFTRNLVKYFHDDPEINDWLSQQWQREEIRHGMALKRYVNTVWPEFDWDRTLRRFSADYTRLCRPERLGPTPVASERSLLPPRPGTGDDVDPRVPLQIEPLAALGMDLLGRRSEGPSQILADVVRRAGQMEVRTQHGRTRNHAFHS